ncbi:MAG TPA: sigma-70 family RNA polymerase sigma factor [Thermoguttaceae bacterium]|nr:sigma-70 family RNA polymerase sigma factor [Thermoguttaceae bacterium]
MNRRTRIEDELLVLRSQEGDVAAFDQLVGRWQERLWRHAWRLLGDEDAAWDALQEAWIGISRGIRRLEVAAAFPAWAYRITSNKCRDRIRRERRRRQAVEEYAEQVRQTDDDASHVDDRSADLQEALARLPGHDRAILSLRYEEGFDTAEIAAILRVPEGTVKSRLHYARKRLRKYLEG